jgi:ubiquitin C-terminal hydrolase
MQGDKNEYYSCDECKGRTAATINMRIHRFPRILMLHIKRFTYTGDQRPAAARWLAPAGSMLDLHCTQASSFPAQWLKLVHAL